MPNDIARVAGTPTIRSIALWLLVTFVAAVLTFLIWSADAPDGFFLSIVLLPWIVGPAVLAALLATRAWSTLEGWLFVGAEVAAVISTVGLWAVVLLMKSGHADSENGIALILFPILQFGILLIYFFGIMLLAPFLQKGRVPRL